MVNDIGYADVDAGGAIVPTLRDGGIGHRLDDPRVSVSSPVRRHCIWFSLKPVQLGWLSNQLSSSLMLIKQLLPESAVLDGSL